MILICTTQSIRSPFLSDHIKSFNCFLILQPTQLDSLTSISESAMMTARYIFYHSQFSRCCVRLCTVTNALNFFMFTKPRKLGAVSSLDFVRRYAKNKQFVCIDYIVLNFNDRSFTLINFDDYDIISTIYYFILKKINSRCDTFVLIII